MPKTANTIKSKIFLEIEKSVPHTIFFLGDFARYGSIETVRKIFQQATILGLVSHVACGVYVKKKVSKFGEVPVSIEAIAREIAKRDHCQIIPTGLTAVNLIGLSTQVPMVLSYLTTGSSRTVRIGNRAIKFVHSAPRNFACKSASISLVSQAMKEIGMHRLTPQDLYVISLYLQKSKEKKYYQSDLFLIPRWMQKLLAPIVTVITKDETLATTQQK